MVLIRKISVFLRVVTAVFAGCCLYVSCRKTEVISITSDEYILFGRPAMSVETKSTFLNSLPDGSFFGVLGYCLAYEPGTETYNPISGTSAWGLKRNSCPPAVFYKEKVTVSSNSCSYGDSGNPATLKKWYADGHDEELDADLSDTENFQYSFFAYYPFESRTGGGFGITPEDAATAGAPEFRFTMPFESGDKDDYSTVLDSEDTPDAMLSVIYNRKKGGGHLRFNFSHIMTGIGFRVNNYSEINPEGGEPAGQDLTIYSIRLRGTFYRSVNIDLTGSSVNYTYPADDVYKGTYTLYENPDGQSVPWKDGENSFLAEHHVMLLPGPGESYLGPAVETGSEGGKVSDIKVLVDYRFGDGEIVRGHAESRPGSFTPRSGVRYTAYLNWVGNSFVLVFQPDNGDEWEDGEADDESEDNDDIVFE